MQQNAEKIKVMLFEDNPHLRDSLSTLINSSDMFTCVAAVPDATRIIPDIKANDPQLLLMDIEMPGRNGIEASILAKKSFPDLPILMLTAFDDDNRIFQSLCAGGSGYLLKDSTPDQILAAMGDVYHGESALSPSIAKRVVRFFQTHQAPTLPQNLTEKEKETLLHLADGKSYKMIAHLQHVTLETVKTHMKNIYRKLHVNNGSEAVAKAIRGGII
jgi:DNA-binding NarL/FixJ family response regulator